ncbi:MAG: hypothetical protein ACD_65C00286G0002 [uncultured bacterium]|nr:MAG: hypothetical protein ACD_65C00286G0002 [uncultured bacterium]KKT02382.1 MAG: triosephosphate isomerase, triosephosphate isomerase (TIM) [Candidatus Peregrinibacteria bacterium GW2011_GWF2_43_17]HAU39465.1 triose-phosphate isomerase [Candidatus Peregrinibacteria bacterium]
MDLPIIITNFKTYMEATGGKALDLAKAHAKVAIELKVSLGIAVQPTDLVMLAAGVSLPVFAQHMDAIEPGAHTGGILPEAIKNAGAYGVIINHSEKRVPFTDIEKNIKRAKDLKLFTIVCCADDVEAAQIVKFEPDMIAVEPPELIGGDISISTANPDLIRKSVAVVGKGRLIVGAGVKTADDIKIALELGASGILLASGVVKAKEPEKVLRELCGALK